MKLIKKLSLFVIVVILSYFLSGVFGALYGLIVSGFNIYSLPPQGYLSFAGFPLAYLFLTPLTCNLFLKGRRKEVIILLSIPVLFFEIYFDPLSLYIPLILSVAGYYIGLYTVTRYPAMKKLITND